MINSLKFNTIPQAKPAFGNTQKNIDKTPKMQIKLKSVGETAELMKDCRRISQIAADKLQERGFIFEVGTFNNRIKVVQLKTRIGNTVEILDTKGDLHPLTPCVGFGETFRDAFEEIIKAVSGKTLVENLSEDAFGINRREHKIPKLDELA